MLGFFFNVVLLTVGSGAIDAGATQLVAWGDNSQGQTNLPPGISNVVAISAGVAHNLGLRSDRKVVSWENRGLEGTDLPAGLSNVVAVAAGLGTSFAVRENGTVSHWGWRGIEMNPPGQLTNVVAIAAGWFHAVALQDDGKVTAWGRNTSGQLERPGDLADVVAVAAGGLHSLALKADGSIVAFGNNDYGQATVPAHLTGVVAIAAGGYHSLALKADGNVVAWGYAGAGAATIPPGLNNVVAIAGGANHSLALKSDGHVVAWGDNSSGQTTIPAGLSSVIAIAAGGSHSVAVTGDRCQRVFPVTSRNDSGLGSLRQAVENANENAGGTVLLGSLRGIITLTSGELLLTNCVNVIGPGATKLTISGSGFSRIFNIDVSATAFISGLKVRDGVASLQPLEWIAAGGGIYNAGRLVLRDCHVVSNSNPGYWAGARGGGIYNSGTIDLSECKIYNNSAMSSRGTLRPSYGAGIYNGGEMTLRSCEISTNQIEGLGANSAGGGIYNDGELTCIRCQINDNYAGEGAGNGPDPAEAGGAGGGLCNLGRATILDCMLARNASGQGGSGYFGGYSGGDGGGGGAIWNGGNLSLTRCVAIHNRTGNGGSGGVYWNLQNRGGTGGKGGGLFNANIAAITNCTFVLNLCGSGGKGGDWAVWWHCDDFCSGANGGDGGAGGAVWNQGLLTVCHSTINENGSGIAGVGGTGFPGLNGHPPTPPGSTGTIGRGGGVALSGSGNPAQFINSLIASNRSDGGSPDILGDFVSLGFNLVADPSGSSGFSPVTGDLLYVDPLLSPPADNGGLTLTCALLPGSPAINAGTNDVALNVDQRGVPRPQGRAVDIGAYEYVNANPTISSITAPVLLEDSPAAPIEFSIDDVETPAGELIVTASSSNSALIRIEDILLGGVDGQRTISFLPEADEFGTCIINITVTDADGGMTTTSCRLDVDPVNDPPTLAPIVDQTMYAGTVRTVDLLGVTPGPTNENRQEMIVSASSSVPQVIPDPMVHYSGSNFPGSMELTPASNASGVSRLTVTVRDDGGTERGGVDAFSRSFQVRVLPQLRWLVGSVSGRPSGEVALPVRATGFNEIRSFQFSMHWDAAVVDYLGSEQFALPNLGPENIGTTQINEGTVTIAWSTPTGSCPVVADGTTIFVLRLRLRGEWGSTNNLTIDGVPLPVGAVNCAGGLVPIATRPGQVILPPLVTLAGAVYAAESTNTIADVNVNLSRSQTNDVAVVTGPDGRFVFAELPGDLGYRLTPIKTNDLNPAQGVTKSDIMLVRRNILGQEPLDSGWKMLAADVDGSHSISTVDISLIRRLTLGFTTSFPAGLWRFVPSDYVFADPRIPWNAPTNRAYAHLTVSLTNEDFRAIKLGDIDGTRIGSGELLPPAVGDGGHEAMPDSSGSTFAFNLSRHIAQSGDVVRATITTEGFRSVSSAQFTLEWNPAVLRYLSNAPAMDGMGADNFGTGSIAAGKLAFSWDETNALTVTMEDGELLFSAMFAVIGGAGTETALTLTDSIATRELGVDYVTTGFRTGNGRVTVIKPAMISGVNYLSGEGVFEIFCETVEGLRYTLEYSDSLPATHWTSLPTITGNGTVVRIRDATATGRQRFYRVRRE